LAPEWLWISERFGVEPPDGFVANDSPTVRDGCEVILDACSAEYRGWRPHLMH
jgi:hypothetical protein